MHLINHEQQTLDFTKISKNIEHLEEDMKAANKISELEAALKGIVMLKDTYNLNIDDMVRGSSLDNTGLSYNDLYLMAGMVCDRASSDIIQDSLILVFQAVKMKWYDTSIKFLRYAKSKNHSLQDVQVLHWIP